MDLNDDRSVGALFSTMKPPRSMEVYFWRGIVIGYDVANDIRFGP